MAQTKKTLYDILGVPRDADGDAIHTAYERQRGAHEAASSADANAINVLRQAYDVLKDGRRRDAYDASLAISQERSTREGLTTPHEEPEARKLPVIPIVAGVMVVAGVLFFAMRPGRPPPPRPPEPQAAVEASKPAPAAPKLKSGVEIMADASTSGGALLGYSMSGQGAPIGVALSTEPGMMVTTCHSIPAGDKLVVRVGSENFPADLVLADGVLDLCKLQVANFGAPPVKLATEEPKAGDKIFAVGVNAAGEAAVTEGTVKQVLNTTEGRLFELSMPIGQHSSGGGVFDAYGRLVGIATVQHRSGLSIALPASGIAQMRSRGSTK